MRSLLLSKADDLAETIKKLPAKPGVYQFFSEDGVVLYVGKAKSLKSRVRHYISSTVSHKTQKLMSKARRIEYTLTSNEYEALLLEANLIKRYKPRYNILLRDDKSYPYVAVSKDKYPRLTLQRGRVLKKFQYFGPYADAGSVRETIVLLQKLFKLRSCSDGFFKNRSRPCLQYQIERCSAPCVAKVSGEAYQSQVNDALRFMQGKHEEVFSDLSARMKTASAELRYEEAAEMRDQLALLRDMQDHFIRVPGIENADIIAAVWGGARSCVCVLMIRNAQVMGKHVYPLKYSVDDGGDFWQEFLLQYYLAHKDESSCCTYIYIAQAVKGASLIERALQGVLENKIQLKTRMPQAFSSWYDVARVNAQNALNKLLTDHADIADRLTDLCLLLKLPHAIDRIECFDVSHTHGKETVASCVVCATYGMDKSAYRRYSIKEAKGSDDYGAMREALWVHFKNKVASGETMPNVLLIDGGKGQLKIAAEVLTNLQIEDVDLLGIVKGEGRREALDRILLYPSKRELEVQAYPKVMYLLQQIRNEAHRFACKTHRKKRQKAYKASVLDAISGVGPVMKKSLLTHFGGMQAVKKASLKSLAKVPGVGEKNAKKIFDALQADKYQG